MNQTTSGQPSSDLPQRAPSIFGGRRKLFIAVAMLAMALGYFAYTAFQGATVFYLTVDELLSGGAEVGKTVRVSGKLVSNSFQREPQGTVAYFSLTDGRQILPAAYQGAGLPELFFNQQSDIVLEGYYDSQGVFQSREVIVKCPSKYEAVASTQRTASQ